MSSTTATQTDRYAQSAAAFAKARALMPGGVSSPVRAYKAVGREPVTVRSGKGAIVTDIDGNEYIDYVMSYGPLILGHVEESVLAAISKAAGRGTSFGMPTKAETRLARVVIDAVPSVEVVRFVNSGTEAVMSAIRLARGATGRAKVVKCTGLLPRAQRRVARSGRQRGDDAWGAQFSGCARVDHEPHAADPVQRS